MPVRQKHEQNSQKVATAMLKEYPGPAQRSSLNWGRPVNHSVVADEGLHMKTN